MTTEYLFVYGSLLLNIGSPMSAFLSQNSSFVGAGTVQGKLYDLGSYPGLVFDNQLVTTVVGHVFELKSPQKVWSVLDEYECIEWENLAHSQYRRELVEVDLQTRTINSWAYIYNQSPEGLIEIESGNYATYWENVNEHRYFINQGR